MVGQSGNRRVALVRRVVFFTALLVLWEAFSRSGIREDYLFPGPIMVAQTLFDGVVRGDYVQGALVSMQRIAIGYGISLVLGVALGALIARNAILEDTLGALVIGLQALPSVCWLPLAILWLGLNESAIQFVVVMGALFSIVLGVRDGVRSTSPIFVKAARSLGAHGAALYLQVVVPAALPSIVAGLRVSAGLGWQSLVGAELIVAAAGVGFMMVQAQANVATPTVMAGMIAIGVVGMIIDVLLRQWEAWMRRRRGLEA